MADLAVIKGRSSASEDGLGLPPLRLEPGSLAALLTGTSSALELVDRRDQVAEPGPAVPSLAALVAELRALRSEVDALSRDLREDRDHLAAIRDELAALRSVLIGP